MTKFGISAISRKQFGCQWNKLVIGDYTDIQQSEKKFNIDTPEQPLVLSEVSMPIKLDELEEKIPFQNITVTVKALQADKPLPIHNGKQV